MVLSQKIHRDYIPYVVLTFPLLIDSLNGYMRGAYQENDSAIGLLFKGAVIVYSVLYTRAIKSRYILLLFSFFSIGLLFQLVYGIFITETISAFLKTVYCFFILRIFVIKRCNIKDVMKAGIFYGLGAALLLIGSYLFGWGYSSYSEESGSFGVKGFFSSGNDICLTILLLNCLSILMFQKTKSVFYLFSTLIMSLGGVLMGSIAGVLGTGLILLLYMLTVFMIQFKDYQSSNKERLFVVVSAVFTFLYVVSALINIILNDSTLAIKYEDLWLTFTEVSGRKRFIDASLVVISQRNIIFDIFGQGSMYLYMLGQKSGMGYVAKGAESDYYDILGLYGIFITIMLIYFPIKAFLRSLRMLLKYKSIVYFWIIIATAIFLGHAYYGGHALTSPISYVYYIIFLYILIDYRCLKYK